MKLQNLAIIFLVIMIPLIMILSYYLNLQRETLELQAEYDTKLASATKEGIKAFEINTVDWSEWVNQKTRSTEREDARAAINTFITSLANNLNISGTAKEYMQNYIPAIAMTMYDGYYVYSSNYVPVSILTDNNQQLYYDGTRLTTTDGNGKNLPIYKPKDGVATQSAKYAYLDDEYNYREDNFIFVTDINDAEMEYKHILSSQIAYVEEYSKGTDTNVVINYTLDNRIHLYGIVEGNNVARDGYLVYFDTDTVLPRIKIKANAQNDDDIDISKSVNETIYSNGKIKTKIAGEILEEQILYYESGTYHLENFKYIYDIEHEKLYYDENAQDFFTLSGNQRVFINNSLNPEIKYKSVSILLGDGKTTQYKKIYQALNGSDKGKWYISIKEDSIDAINQGIEEIDTEIKSTKLQELGLDSEPIYKDYSAINYYVEAYAFTNWMQDNLGDINVTVEGTPTKIFEITSTNNPEDETSPIVLHKKQVMREHIETNLNLAISNYSMGTYEYKLPVMDESDWEQIFSNISMITFFQGAPIGLKTYNNYAIATSTNNREYVDPNEIYLSRTDGEPDGNYHKAYCEQCGNSIYTGYRSVEYVLKEYDISDEETWYYYQHDKLADKTSETACYYCLVNRANYVAMLETDAKYEGQTKSYNEALARERYYQKEEITGKLGITVTYHYNVDGWDDIKNKQGLPGAQEAEIGEQVTISTRVPTIESTNPFIKYVFVGWSDNPGTTDIKYMPGEVSDILYENENLYAIWRVSLAHLNWNVDYLWKSDKTGFTLGTSDSNGKWTGPWGSGVSDGSISYIEVDETSGGSRVQMVGNSIYSGKGATWATFESEFLSIAQFQFDYEINKGDSFNAAGFMFNITETDTTLEGYMLSINFAGDFYRKTMHRIDDSGREDIDEDLVNDSESEDYDEDLEDDGGSDITGQHEYSNGAIYKFTYNKGKNDKNVEIIELVQPLDIGVYDENRGSNGNGTITITVANNGYNISGSELDEDYFLPVDNINSDTFGFFSDHYDHNCEQIGYFKLENIKVIAVRNKV